MSQFASLILAATATTTIFSDYPGFVDPTAAVEAYFDRGPILELIIKCPEGTGIVSYSKIERLFCSSKRDCFASLKSASKRTCE